MVDGELAMPAVHTPVVVQVRSAAPILWAVQNGRVIVYD